MYWTKNKVFCFVNQEIPTKYKSNKVYLRSRNQNSKIDLTSNPTPNLIQIQQSPHYQPSKLRHGMNALDWTRPRPGPADQATGRHWSKVRSHSLCRSGHQPIAMHHSLSECSSVHLSIISAAAAAWNVTFCASFTCRAHVSRRAGVWNSLPGTLVFFRLDTFLLKGVDVLIANKSRGDAINLVWDITSKWLKDWTFFERLIAILFGFRIREKVSQFRLGPTHYYRKYAAGDDVNS